MVDSQYLELHLSKFDFDKPSEYDKPELEPFFQCIPYIRKAAIYCVKCLYESLEENGGQKLENNNEKMNYNFKVPVTLFDLSGYFPFLEKLIDRLQKLGFCVNLTRNEIFAEWHKRIHKYGQEMLEKKVELDKTDKKLQSQNDTITRRLEDRELKNKSIEHEKTMSLHNDFSDTLTKMLVPEAHKDDILRQKKIEELKEDLEKIDKDLVELKEDYSTLRNRQEQNKKEFENIQNIFNHINSSESIDLGLIEDLSKFQYHLSNMKVSMEAYLYGIKLFNLNDNNANDNIVRLNTYLSETGSTVYVSTDTNSTNVLSALFAARYFQQFQEDLSDLDQVKYSVFMEFFNGFALPLIKSKVDNEKDFFVKEFIEKDSSMKEVKRNYTDFKVTYDFLSTNGKIQSLVDLI